MVIKLFFILGGMAAIFDFEETFINHLLDMIEVIIYKTLGDRLKKLTELETNAFDIDAIVEALKGHNTSVSKDCLLVIKESFSIGLESIEYILMGKRIQKAIFAGTLTLSALLYYNKFDITVCLIPVYIAMAIPLIALALTMIIEKRI